MIRLFNASIAPATLILVLFEAILLLGAFVLATLAVGNLDPLDYLLYGSGPVALLLVVLSFLLGLHFQDLYTEIRVKSRMLLLQRLCMVTGGAFIVQGLIGFLDSDLSISVRVMVLGSAIVMPCIFLGRLLFGNLALHILPQTPLVLIGRSPTMTQFRTWIDEQPGAGLVVERVAETLDEIRTIDRTIKRQQPPHLVFGGQGETAPELAHEVLELDLAGYRVETAAAAYEKSCGRLSLYSLRPLGVIPSEGVAGPPRKSFFQLLLQGFLIAIGLVVALPAVALTALLLRATSRGPVWHSEPLTGLNGQVFRGYGFEVAGNGMVAKMVRRFRLEELPRFLNVLKGEMGFVGPRAERPEYTEALERQLPFYRERYSVRPGMTGWAQVRLYYDAPYEETMAKMEYDLYYIKNMSFGLDTLILLHTIESLVMVPPAPARVLERAPR